MNRLLRIKTFSFEVLEELGIEYSAPVDLVLHPLDTKIDFVFSNSVLEHVPISDVVSLLQNIAIDISDGGKMIHCVHLEGHKDSQNTPFDFLSESAAKFTKGVQSSRGNRIRRSQWKEILLQVKDMDFRFIYE